MHMASPAKPALSRPQSQTPGQLLDKARASLSPHSREVFDEAFSRVTLTPSIVEFWRRLSPEQRQLLGNDVEIASLKYDGAVGMWCRLTGATPGRAVLEVAQRIGFLDQFTVESLTQELGERLKRSKSAILPFWNNGDGTLRYGKHLARTVRVMAQPSNIQIILDAFQAANWTTTIPNPLAKKDQQRLHQALRSLNGGLRRLRFQSQQGGQVINWVVR